MRSCAAQRLRTCASEGSSPTRRPPRITGSNSAATATSVVIGDRIDIGAAAAALGRPVVVDSARGVAALGVPAPAVAEAMASLRAPDFSLPDLDGNLVTLADFAHDALGRRCPVPLWTDDEGTEARDAYLIVDGVLCSFMHNKETAEKLGQETTGNARAFAFSDEPLVRMRNTAILPGKSKLEDMLAGLDEGYYFMKSSNGQADSTSEFMFGVVQGYEVRKGKLGRALKDTTISGVAFDMLKTVSALSDDMVWSCGGMCGKKQMIPVGMGGPAVRCRINVGGR